MEMLIRTGDAVLITFAQSLLRDAGIEVFVADQHIALTEGSIGAFPRRIMVAADDAARARRVLTEAGLAHELADREDRSP